jgi:hypothetical protein
MLKVDPYKRLSASEALNHPWITGPNISTVHLEEAHAAMRQKYFDKKNRQAQKRAQQQAHAAAAQAAQSSPAHGSAH